MRVFRTTYKDRDGKTKTAQKWYVEFRDHLEQVRRLPAFTDRAQSETFGRKLLKLVEVRANRETASADLNRWLEGLPRQTREALARFGIVEAHKAAAVKLLVEHLADFRTGLLAKGGTQQHADLTHKRALTVFEACGFCFWSDVAAGPVESYLADRRKGITSGADDKNAKNIRKLSRQSSNYYLAAVRQFCRWMVRSGRAAVSPLEHLSPLNAAVGPRRERRALSVDELRRLLSATHAGPVRLMVSGPERALLYRLAAETGLRANELRSLTRASFRFGAKLATVTVEAGASKRRRRDELPLRADTAAALAAHLRDKHPGASAFVMPRKDAMADMIRADLAAARGLWLAEALTVEDRTERERSTFLCQNDEAGRTFDFHGLRHSFLTNLARAGVHPKRAQQLARHSSIDLTMGRYTHVTVEEQAEAVDSLPSLDGAIDEALRATGTAGKEASPVLAFCLARKGSELSNSVRSDAARAEDTYVEPEVGLPQQNAADPEDSRVLTPMRLVGLEPTAYGLKVHPVAPLKGDDANTCDTEDSVLAFCLALFEQEYPDLAALAKGWGKLPPTLRARIVALVAEAEQR